MRTRDRMALNLSPLCLRLPLALIFIWAGLGKIISESPISPDQAIILQSHGISVPNAPDLTAPSDQPADTAPDPEPESASTTPETESPVATDPTSETPSEPLPDPEPADSAAEPDAPPPSLSRAHTPRITLVQDGQAPEPEPLTTRNVNQLVLLMDKCANPHSLEDGSANTPTWPQLLAGKPWPKTLAWAVALTEVFAGFFLLVGLITRLSALALSGVMLGAIWLTTLSTAIQSGDALLGFIPNEPFLTFFWKDPFWQLICLMACLALFFAGPGTLALDRAIFAPSSADDWDDDDDDERDRSSFDRAP